MNTERKILIERLSKIHPYPVSWFESRTTAQLIAIYNTKKKIKPENNAMAKIKDPLIKGPDHRRYNELEGLWEVKTDGHGWEPESR